MKYSVIYKSLKFCFLSLYCESSLINHLLNNITHFYASPSIQWVRFTLKNNFRNIKNWATKKQENKRHSSDDRKLWTRRPPVTVVLLNKLNIEYYLITVNHFLYGIVNEKISWKCIGNTQKYFWSECRLQSTSVLKGLMHLPSGWSPCRCVAAPGTWRACLWRADRSSWRGPQRKPCSPRPSLWWGCLPAPT